MSALTSKLLSLTIVLSCLHCIQQGFAGVRDLERVVNPSGGPIKQSVHQTFKFAPFSLFQHWCNLGTSQQGAELWRADLLGLLPRSSRKEKLEEKLVGSGTFLTSRRRAVLWVQSVTVSIFSTICQEYFQLPILGHAALCKPDCPPPALGNRGH